MKSHKRKPEATGFTGYTDAPAGIEKELARSKRVKDFLPGPQELDLKSVSEEERKRSTRAWKRYRIKEHERGHRRRISNILKEPTHRLDTSLILPENVYKWVSEKPNKAAFIRDTLIERFKKTG